MGKLKNFKKMPFEIASVLTDNSTIRKLVTIDSKDALSKDGELSAEEMLKQNYISFYAPIESGIKNVTHNTFIIINLEDFNFYATEGNTSASGAVYITTDASHALLEGNKLRLLELLDAVENTLNNAKLTVAGKIEVFSATFVVLSEFRSGYRISFRCNDLQSRKAEI